MPKKRQISRREPAGFAQQEQAIESQAMRYLSRFQHPDAALPIERSVAEVVSRLILFCKPMHRGSDFIRLGASAAGGLVWSEYVLEWVIDELRESPRRHARGEPVDESLQDCTRSHRQLALMKLSGDLIGEDVMRLSELVDPEELVNLSNEWFNPLIRDYPLRSRLAHDTLQWLRKSPVPESLPHQANAVFLADGLGLDPAGARLLDLIGLCIAAPALNNALATIDISDFKRGLRILANLIDCNEATIESLFHPDGMLRRCGVLERTQDPGGRHQHSSLDELLTCHNPRLRSALTQSFDSAQAFFASFLTAAAPSLIELSDVHHLRRFTEMTLPALRNASAQGEPGLNIMLYGPPGTGKTEYAKLLACEAGLQLFEVDCEDSDGTGLNTSDRLGSLILAMQSLKGRRDAMVLLDEAEDVFPDIHHLYAKDQGFNPDIAIADAGTGLRAGYKLVWGDKPCHGDVFHILHLCESLTNVLASVARGAATLRQAMDVKMNDAKEMGCGNTRSLQLGVARRAEMQTSGLAKDIKTLSQWLRRDVLELAGRCLATRVELFDFVTAELVAREHLDTKRIRPVRVALQNQRDDLLAFAGVLDGKLEAIAQTQNLPMHLVRQVCVLQRKSDTSPAYWQGWC